jgi:hypothetical protein
MNIKKSGMGATIPDNRMQPTMTNIRVESLAFIGGKTIITSLLSVGKEEL